MNRLFTALIAGAISATSMAGVSPSSVRNTSSLQDEGTIVTKFGDHREIRSNLINFGKLQTRRAPASDEETTVEFKVKILQASDGSEYGGRYAFAIDCNDPRMVYPSSPDENLECAFELPEGTYDFLVPLSYAGDGYDYVPIEFAVMQALGVSTSDKELTLAIDDCTITTKWSPVLPGGITPVSIYDPSGNGNSGGIFCDLYFCNSSGPFYSNSIMDFPPEVIFHSNMEQSPVYALPIGTYMGTYGVAKAEAKVEFNGKDVTTTEDKWRVADSYSFQPTPLNINVNNIEESYYVFSTSFTFFEGGYGSGGVGSFDVPVPSGKIMMWRPKDYTASCTFVQPTGMSFNGNEAFIGGLYLGYMEEGLVPMGVNPSGEYKFDEQGASVEAFLNGNQRYSGSQYLNVLLGNCTPSQILMPYATQGGTGLKFSYVGNYGEEMTIDSYNLAYEVDPEYLDMFGGPVCDVTVSRDGKEVCSSYLDFADIKWKKGSYVVEMRTDNILIDSDVPGYNKSVVTFDEKGENGALPTVTALQFRDADDAITNRFDKADGNFMEFYAGDFTYAISDRYAEYYKYSPLEEVKVEYSPKDADDWSELKVEEIEDLFFMPGYGACYRADLSSVDKKSDAGWYDVRVSVVSSYGASQQQVISPAFNISSMSAIGSVADMNGDVKVVGRNILAPEASRIYTVSGKRVSGSNLMPGIYIVKTPSDAEKVIVK